MANSDYISREAAEKVFSQPVTMSMCLTLEECKQKNAQRQIDLFVIRGLPAADVRPRWIPVGERLPETGVDVLVKFPQNMAVASIDIGEWVVNSGDGWCTDINLAGGEKNPTHWMPLPQGPEEE